ncbi:hypothetical protein FB567DRAFT_523712 [Paraphoma chrysanthemicola]|uniref:Uncharacterized protein n=1 Tax=Paraphoma chrysanthemicola TaxID=798071 RepID=A0A8K0VYN2_9PLEO|nr:hypothetical protein FB567DRAFT_523712 [Paraphoma chrysanthemicola]
MHPCSQYFQRAVLPCVLLQGWEALECISRFGFDGVLSSSAGITSQSAQFCCYGSDGEGESTRSYLIITKQLRRT